MRTAALATLSLVLAAPPAAGQCPTYCPPEVSLEPHHPDLVAASPFDATLSYSTPAYVSMDVPRSVSLFYSSHQAAPYAYVQVDVRTLGSTPPQATSIQVVNPATGVVLSPERFYTGADTVTRVVRLAAQWDVSTSPTGSYAVRVIVRNYWNNGAQVQSTSRDTRVVVVNERSSRFGLGWSMPGLLRLTQLNGQNILLTAGDGSAGYFVQSGCTPLDFNSAYLKCDYTSPRGDFSALRLNTQTGLFTRVLRDGTKQVFDGMGKLMYVESRFLHRTTYNWQTVAGHAVPASIVDPAGRTTVFGYNAHARLSSITTPGTGGGRQSTIAYRDSVRVLRINEPGGSVAVDSVVLNAAGRLLSWRDGGGGGWDVSYDHTQSIDQLQAPQVQSTAGFTRPTTTTRSLREMTVPAPSTGTTLGTRIPAVRVDGLWVKVTDASGDSAVATPPGGFGEPARARDVNGLIGRTWVDSLGRDTLVITAKGDTTRSTWAGPLLTRVEGGRELNQNNIPVAKWAYHFWYGTYDLVTQTTGSGQRPRNFHYGSYGQLDSTTTNVVGEVTRYTYGSDRRLVSVTDAGGLQTTFHRSASGWMNTDSVKSQGRRMAYTYDQYGRPQQTTNPLGHTTSTTFDVLNRVLSSTNERGHTTTFSHTPQGLAQVTDAISQTYGFQRNALGWVGVSVDPRGQADTIGYTPVGNVATFRNRRGQTITTTHDARNRPLTVTSGGSTLRTYSYDPNGRWTAITSGAITDTIHTDTAGLVVREATVRGGVRYQVQTHRHHDGRPSSLVASAPSASVTTSYGYDSDRISSIQFGGINADVLYNTMGQVRQLNMFGSGAYDTITYSYTTEHALSAVRFSESAVDQAFGVVYDRDLLGRIQRRKKPVTDSTRTYRYDPAGQLLSHNDSATVQVCEWDPYIKRQICAMSRQYIGGGSYSYDAVGNRTGSGIALDPAKGNRLVSFGGYTFQYDADGNLTRKYNTGNPSTFDQTLTWNVLGQLTAVTTSKSGTTTSVAFQYDGLGRRATKTVGGVVTRYIYSGGHVLMEGNGTGSVLATYAYKPGVDAPLAMQRGGTTYLYAQEATGNVTGLYTTAGQVAARYRYGPWGQIEHEMTGGVQNPLRYTGREWDAETGLYYYRARYYDPQIGRFISEDPIGLAGGINPYVYAANDPVNLRDPSGLNPRCTSGEWPGSDRRFGKRFSWTFMHHGEEWIGESDGVGYKLCPVSGPTPVPGSTCAHAGCVLREPSASERARVLNVLNNIRTTPDFCSQVKAAGLGMFDRQMVVWDNFTLNPLVLPRREQLFGNSPYDSARGGVVMYLYSRDFGSFTTHVIVHEAVHGVVRRLDQIGQPMFYADGAITPLGTIDQTAAACRPR